MRSTYFRIISDKTASLDFKLLRDGRGERDRRRTDCRPIKSFGEYLGMAFQIQDDVLDYEGKRATLGKPIGGDIRERKVTLPFIYAFGNAPKREARSILRVLKNGKRGSRIEVK